MAKCPKCGKELVKPNKTWKYRVFKAESYICSKCGANFREYTKGGKHGFTLMLRDGKFRKAG